MKKNIMVTVNYSVDFDIKVDSEISLEDFREQILDKASHVLEISPIDPTIKIHSIKNNEI